MRKILQIIFRIKHYEWIISSPEMLTQQAIYLDELSQLPSWAGRQHHLSELPLEGNGQIIVKDLASRQCIYKTSFSSLFQEWLSTDEAKETAKGFENTFPSSLSQDSLWR